MKISRYIFTIALFTIGTTISLQAQDTIINRNVSVEREYRPVIQDAGKVNAVPQILEPTVEKTPAKYSDFNLPLVAGYNIHTLAAAEITKNRPTNKEGFARIGLGNYLNTLVDFAYPVVNTQDIRLDVDLNHLGTFESRRMHSTTKAGLSFDKLFKTVDLYASVGGGHEYLKYYGYNFNLQKRIADLSALDPAYVYSEVSPDWANQTYVNTFSNQPTGDRLWRFNAAVGIRSLPLSTELYYMAEVNYNIFSSLNGMSENIVHSLAKFSSPSNENRLGIDFELYNMMYDKTNKTLPLNFWNSYSVMILNPYYSFDRENWNVRLGVKSAFSFVHGNPVNPSVDVLAEWKVFPKFLSIYGGINGDYEVNTLDKIYKENPYLYSDIRVNDTYTPYKLFAGIKLKTLYNLLIDGYVDLRQINNQYFFVNKVYSLTSHPEYVQPNTSNFICTNRFDVVYSDATLLKIGVRASYNLQNFLTIELKGAYNDWRVAAGMLPWNKPIYEAELNTNVKINKELSLTANVFYESQRVAKNIYSAVFMNDKSDINLGVNYSYNNWLTVFGKINNLTNTQYQNFYGYDVQGANVMVGAAFTF